MEMGEPAFGDLVEFLKCWAEFRDRMVELSSQDDLSDQDREVLTVMIFIVDRVQPRDLADDGYIFGRT